MTMVEYTIDNMANNSESVEITSQGIKKVLKKYKPERAVAEYIWNGFDAHASEIHVSYNVEQAFYSITELSVKDNGDGIVYEELPVVFKNFYESHKKTSNDQESRFARGKNGYGRLTFFKFANHARWYTIYKKENGFREYSIDIDTTDLKNYVPGEVIESQFNETQTEVVFTDICADELSKTWVETVLKPYLRADFAWFLKLHPDYKIYVNNEVLDCSSVIADSEEFPLTVSIEDGDDELFHCYYFLWSVKPEEEYSRFYFMNADGELKHQETTLLNNRGDDFWHSILVKSTFFNSFTYTGEDGKRNLFDTLPERRKFKQLNQKLNDYLRDKRKPFLKVKANELVADYEKEELFAFIGSAPWEKTRKNYLTGFIKELYEVEPAVFTTLNTQQKKVFIRLLDQVMDTDNNDSLFKILGAIVDLDDENKKRFSDILETTQLKSVIATMQLIEDRMETIKNFRAVNFDHGLKAGEVKHLQKLIEKHYWIFGEEFKFICSENTKFQGALDKYKYALYGAKDEKDLINHPDQYKEMDLFVSGQEYRYGKPFNLVVEIKNPTNVPELKWEHYSQIVGYVDVIMNSDAFQNPAAFWNFMLIGLKADSKVQSQIVNKLTGECPGGENYKLYVKYWSQILDEAEARLKFLYDEFEQKRDRLSKAESLDEIMEETLNNSAAVKDVE